MAASTTTDERPSGTEPEQSVHDFPLEDFSLERTTDRQTSLCRVELVFGSTNLTYADFQKLQAHDLLTLDEPSNQPVQLVVHKQVIAQGTIVVVDGKLGLHVSQLRTPDA